MAGFINRALSNLATGFSETMLNLSSLGMKYNDMVVTQAKGISSAESQFSHSMGDMPDDLVYQLKMVDIGQRKYISFYDKDYQNKREFLRRFALNPEIEFILDTLTDEAIVYDEKNFFCYPDLTTLGFDVNKEKREELVKDLRRIFNTLYHRFNFNNDITVWNLFKEFLVDGFLCFEIIYSDDEKEVIGLMKMDPITIRPITKETSDGMKKIWVQHENNPKLYRELEDSRIIYISFAQGTTITRVSYVERLIRSHNLLRLMENTRLIWSIMNSTFRLKVTVPIGNTPRQRSDENLNKLLNQLKEEIFLDSESGELSINGRSSIGQMYKNYMYPSRNGESPSIETLAAEGPDMSDMDSLKYFQRKLQMDSKIPSSRFEKESVPTIMFGAEGMDREEIRFYKFINRLRSTFQEMMVKPMMIQLILENPKLIDNELIKSSIGIKFNKDNLFEQMKFIEVTNKRIEFCNNLAAFTQDDGSTPYFKKDFIIDNFSGLSLDQLDANKVMIKELGAGSEKPEKEEK